MIIRVFIFCSIVYNALTLSSDIERQSDNNNYLLPIRPPSPDSLASSVEVEAPNCPHFVHGELRHSLVSLAGLDTSNSGNSGLRFQSLLKPPSSSSSFWTGSLVTVARLDVATSVSVAAPLPRRRGSRRICGRGAVATVAETGKKNGCAVAINAGLFDPDSGRCLGNLVSNGAVLHDSAGVKNAHFGITTKGEVFFGYLTEDQLKHGFFKHLVGGAIWLVRNGTNYVDQSIKAECSDTQTTGSLMRFATVISARSAVGQRSNGDLVLVQIVGKTDVAGINLYDLADLLISMDVHNAINLDGGGSSTLVINGTVVGSPSDYCTGSTHLSCLRPVTSILCVAASSSSSAGISGVGCAACNPNGGACIDNHCVCRPPYTGRSCYERCRCLNSATCSPDTGDCVCPPGYRGHLCENTCEHGFYGLGCSHVCVCGGDDAAACHHVNGTCRVEDTSNREIWSANGAYNLVVLVKKRLAGLNWAVAVLPAILASSCILNMCLLVRHCRLRGTASRLKTRWRQQRQEMKRLVEAGGNSDESEVEAGL